MYGLKIVSDGAPVATFHVGMAWPINKEAVWDVRRERLAGFQIATHAAAADVQWVITDSACVPIDWGVEYADELSFVDSRDYPSGSGEATITLWRFTG